MHYTMTICNVWYVTKALNGQENEKLYVWILFKKTLDYSNWAGLRETCSVESLCFHCSVV